MSNPIDLTKEPMDLADATRQLKAVRAVLEQICAHADYLRQLPPYDAHRKAEQDAWSDARHIAMKALDQTKPDEGGA